MKTLIMLLLCIGTLPVCTACETPPETLRQEAWSTVKTINRLWAIKEDADSLALFLHDDMVTITPQGQESGNATLIKSYRDYMQYAETISFTESTPSIQLFQDNRTAIVSYHGNMTIKNPEGRTETFSFKDMYVLILQDGKWIAIAQYYAPQPE